MRQIPKPYEVYKHFKGNLYQIIAIALDSETGEELVIYQALYGDYKIYARKLSMFLSPVDRVKYPDTKQEYRFELQNKTLDYAADKTLERSEDKTLDRSEDKKVERSVGQTAGQTLAKEESGQKQSDVNMFRDEVSSASQEGELDPMLLQFLDAKTYEEKLNILTGVRHRITQEMLTTMAVANDIELKEGSVEERFDSLKQCLLTLEKYECNRLR